MHDWISWNVLLFWYNNTKYLLCDINESGKEVYLILPSMVIHSCQISIRIQNNYDEHTLRSLRSHKYVCHDHFDAPTVNSSEPYFLGHFGGLFEESKKG
jgi:hypothetical protein